MTGFMSLVLWLGFAGRIGVSSQRKDAPPVLMLTGNLKSETRWGPPGFGETPEKDSRVVIFVLKLRPSRTAKQLSLPEDGEEGEKKFSEIQLRCDSTAFPSCEAALKKSVGHRITVGGEAEPGGAPTDYLPVTMWVRLTTNK
jgi:hypothetical protein